MVAATQKVGIGPGDALIVVDVQIDFLPGGSLAVPAGDEVVPVLNRYLGAFHAKSLPIFATRDWHPVNHCSFKAGGGPWPPHCVAGTAGAAFAPGLKLPPETTTISKATPPDKDAYSGFEGTDLEARVRAQQRLRGAPAHRRHPRRQCPARRRPQGGVADAAPRRAAAAPRDARRVN